MVLKRKYKSDFDEALHSSASALYKVGAIDKATMREFDESCLAVPPRMDPRRIKRIRESQKVSQPVFAAISIRANRRLKSGIGREKPSERL